ncbi:hypothetical protein BaRGS_00010932 [Batillaria attramentaria]|uniref:Uncharacterized protein n=1 Tax=Batillaria attramentaria TaxID=370345 RepID=A0ABD0LEE5_9CAEN
MAELESSSDTKTEKKKSQSQQENAPPTSNLSEKPSVRQPQQSHRTQQEQQGRWWCSGSDALSVLQALKNSRCKEQNHLTSALVALSARRSGESGNTMGTSTRLWHQRQRKSGHASKRRCTEGRSMTTTWCPAYDEISQD